MQPTGLMPGSYAGVLMDLDGVIIDSMPAHVRSWVAACAAEGVRIDPAIPRIREGEKALITCRWISDKYDLGWDDERCAALVERKRELYRAEAEVQVFPGAERAIRGLKSACVPLAVVTGSALVNMQAVVPQELLELFDIRLTAEDYERGKPDPEPYARAAEQLRLRPRDCLAVENAPLGIRSARAAGCAVLALATTLEPWQLAEAHEVAVSHDRILELMIPE